jgi:hypothetical protein
LVLPANSQPPFIIGVNIFSMAKIISFVIGGGVKYIFPYRDGYHFFQWINYSGPRALFFKGIVSFSVQFLHLHHVDFCRPAKTLTEMCPLSTKFFR